MELSLTFMINPKIGMEQRLTKFSTEIDQAIKHLLEMAKQAAEYLSDDFSIDNEEILEELKKAIHNVEILLRE